jgi:hypothetical protein
MKPITDRSARVIAYLNDVNPYRQELRGRSNELLAWYNPQTNQTYDRSGSFVGTGDQRSRFIPDDED